MLLTSGQVLSERYRVIGLLGQGGMAAVYCAHDRSLDRLVAIKQLRPDPTASEAALAQARHQFQREAQVLAELDHPNLPRVTDFFSRDSVEYLVMDYVEGEPLIDVVHKTGGGLGEDQVLDWAEQLLSALDYIHRHNLIHRDVKPANIRLTPDGRIFLVDFGLVKLFDPDNPKTATVMHGLGTPEYAPPEQYDSRLGHTDPRSDVYAMGATLYHLLIGRAPPTATQRISDPDSFRRPRALGPHISADVERVILRAMELQRARRFDNAAEMGAALRLARRHAPAETGMTQRLPRWVLTNRSVWARRTVLLAILALLVMGGIVGLTRGQGDEPSPTPSLPAALATDALPTPPLATATPAASVDQPGASPTQRPTQSGGASQATETVAPLTLTTPSATPTHTPTRLRPTATPTRTPTPTLTPTRQPREQSATPTAVPSPIPTSTPVATRTVAPTVTPRPTAPTETFTPNPAPAEIPTATVTTGTP